MKNKKNIIRISIIIVFIILISLLIILGYKMYVVHKIWDANTNVLMENYCLTISNSSNDTTSKTYYKDGIGKVETITPDEHYYLWQNEAEKQKIIVNINEKSYVQIEDDYYTDYSVVSLPNLLTISGNIFDQYVYFFKEGLVLDTEVYEGKEYYTLRNDTTKIWIDKETYRTIGEDTYSNESTVPTIFYELEINCVTDEDITLPDFSTYTQNTNGFQE